MSKTKIVLNSSGIRSLLKSPEMAQICSDEAKKIQARCGDGFEVNEYVGKNRVNSMIYADSLEAKKDNMKNNTILKSLR